MKTSKLVGNDQLLDALKDIHELLKQTEKPMNLTECAAMLGVSENTVKDYIKDYNLPHRKISNKTYMFYVSEINQWLRYFNPAGVNHAS